MWGCRLTRGWAHCPDSWTSMSKKDDVVRQLPKGGAAPALQNIRL